ncbi:MFS transporter [Mariniluteicoccus endophyticus]
MNLSVYRDVWAIPAARQILLLGLLVRAPFFGGIVLLTVHVVNQLDPRYSAAGMVSTAGTLAVALAGPWRGRMLDRLGLRRTLLPSLVVLPVCWVIAPFVGYWALMAFVIVAGLFAVPSFSIIRNALIAAVDERQRKTALAFDAVLVEMSFMTGPALAVWVGTVWHTGWALMMFELVSVAAAWVIFMVNPRLGGEGRSDEGAEAPRGWLSAPVVAVMLMASAATFVLGASDLTIVAGLRALGHQPSIGWVLSLWGLGSAVGGFLYGASQRSVPPWVLLLGLGAFTIPAAYARSDLTMALLLVIAGLFCAPTLTAGSEALSALVPARARGEAFGWHGSMMTIGSAIGSPSIGLAIDHLGWRAGYLTGGGVGVLIALVSAVLIARRRRTRPVAQDAR